MARNCGCGCTRRIWCTGLTSVRARQQKWAHCTVAQEHDNRREPSGTGERPLTWAQCTVAQAHDQWQSETHGRRHPPPVLNERCRVPRRLWPAPIHNVRRSGGGRMHRHRPRQPKTPVCGTALLLLPLGGMEGEPLRPYASTTQPPRNAVPPPTPPPHPHQSAAHSGSPPPIPRVNSVAHRPAQLRCPCAQDTSSSSTAVLCTWGGFRRG